jgi:S-formylglutathione hydrolase FrmB
MKNWHKLSALIFLLVTLFAYIGCSDRKNPADPVYPKGTVYFQALDSLTLGHVSSLKGNLIGNPYRRYTFVYTPPGYDVADTTKYPVLYFLHGFMDTTLGSSGPGLPYPYGLAETADKLIATGQIQPMIIAMVNCNSYLGGNIPAGSFYVNSPSPTSNPDQSLNGKFENFYVDDFMYWVERSFYVHQDKSYRAIAGHSMGGYGAFRIAMDYDTLFSIVGSMSGPLSFGDWDLGDAIDHIFTVNGVIDPTFYRDSIDKAYQGPDELTRMFFAMAAAFSPHDTSNHDLTSYFKVGPPGNEYGVDLPFDSTGDIITAVWDNRWMANDVKTRYNGNSSKLDDVYIYIDCGDADEFEFNQQSSDFYQGLTSGQKAHSFFEEYSGGGYLSADNSTYLYYRIEKLLKFVSENLPQP